MKHQVGSLWAVRTEQVGTAQSRGRAPRDAGPFQEGEVGKGGLVGLVAGVLLGAVLGSIAGAAEDEGALVAFFSALFYGVFGAGLGSATGAVLRMVRAHPVHGPLVGEKEAVR